ncbi:glycosyltransferase [Marinobacter sp. F4216]|uniref:glycosyltransferase n=1 Tax=Marinobacter sp. F4216 TaxID=2874281 RepID=UPI001CBB5BAA|nr:glycosyltransferase [Marinobacter sp. F4216]MBZ2168418.1 glycosyltransferase [Marinobacter sp. F4216]
MIHIANNFVSSAVHGELVKALSEKIGDQKVVVPIRETGHYGKNSENLEDVQVEYILFNNKVIRFFPLLKVFYIFFLCAGLLIKIVNAETKREVRPTIFAHNFWSDGMIAFFLSFIKPVRYVLVVRNTDVNFFIAKLPHYRWLMRWCIRRSEGLIFVSRAHYDRVLERWPGLITDAKRIQVIANGIDDWWLNHTVVNNNLRPTTACFVGKFNTNKNLNVLIRAAEHVQHIIPDFKLILIGGGSQELFRVTGIQSLPSYVEVVGRKNKKEILEIFRLARLFVMPSLTETFGLVYIEALSQGCSVICSAGEGIDGMWSESFIKAVDPSSPEKLAENMIALLEKYPEGVPVSWINNEISRFNWQRVADKYLEFVS